MFQSAPPVRGATTRSTRTLVPALFQSAPPVRGATFGLDDELAVSWFQSAPPVRGATIRQRPPDFLAGVSIRAPRAGGDGRRRWMLWRIKRFQSAPPVRGATRWIDNNASRGAVSIRVHSERREHNVSIRAPRAGGDYPA